MAGRDNGSVLVTGASGFVGRHVVPLLLLRGFDVHCISRRLGVSRRDGAIWHETDIFDRTATSRLVGDIRPTHLVHLAWTTTPGSYWSDPQNLGWVEASIGLIREFVDAGGRRIVAAGTCAEYDWSYELCKEGETPIAPATFYGVAKASLQALLEFYSREVGVSSAWGRIFMVFGPYEHPARLVPSVARALVRGEEALCSHGEQVRDFLDVRDVAGALAAILESDVTGAVNIGSGEGVSVRDVVTRLAWARGREELLRFGAVSVPAGEPARLVADTRRLSTEVGWEPLISLDSGLLEAMKWWEAAVDLECSA